MWKNEKILLFTVIFVLLILLGLVGKWDISDQQLLSKYNKQN